MSRIPEQAKIDFDAMLDKFDGTDIKFTDSDSENHSLFASIANVDAYSDFVNYVKQNYKELVFDNSITPEFVNYTDYGYISVEFTDDDRINLNVNYDRAIEDDENDIDLDESTNVNSSKRIARVGEFDNGYVMHGDWQDMTFEEAEEKAKEASIKDPEHIYYVANNDIMEPCSDIRWKSGKSYHYSDKSINESGSSDIEQRDNLGICPNCGSNKFNDNIGLCVDCGYDEKFNGDTGTDDYFDESINESPKKEYTDVDKKQLIDDLVKRFFTEGEAIKLVNKDIAYAENLAYGNCTTEDFIEAEDWLANN